MTPAEAFLTTPAESHSSYETPSPLAAPPNNASQGGDGIVTQEEVDAAWRQLAEAKTELYATPLGRMVTAMEQKLMLLERLKKNEERGCSRLTVPCGQAEHLRRAVAGGETLAVPSA